MNCSVFCRLLALFVAFMCTISLYDDQFTANAFNFHRKLSKSPLSNLIQQRINKRVHNLSLLRLGGKLFRTEQPQVKRLVPQLNGGEYELVDRNGDELAVDPAKSPILWLLIRNQESRADQNDEY